MGTADTRKTDLNSGLIQLSLFFFFLALAIISATLCSTVLIAKMSEYSDIVKTKADGVLTELAQNVDNNS